MKRLLLSTMAFASAFAMAPAAHAVDYVPGNPEFTVEGNINNGTVSADFGRSGIAAGAFQDTFNFIIDQAGLASGTLSTSTTRFNSPTDLDILSVFINGFEATKTIVGKAEFFEINNVAIAAGATNQIVVTGTSRGNGSYAGTATFEPTAAVPEAGTWALMLFGIGGIGASMRVRRRQAKIAFA
ncbi:FxDxF family PEP-CTERM protein [Sphingomonas aerolata]|uniref:FxDxF family PEP-CTERM protein n=1 Tax=Sphingomonas aerolata TaxID=185951 RepID=UPI00208DDF49|nr:FxDxF family PEP-CTERM protein [Sphingomonas aerolata]USR01290.1 FxDxF family PEP-CTERM protein [Sphingomonas aerolata]